MKLALLTGIRRYSRTFIRGMMMGTERAPSRVFGDPLAEGSDRPKEEAG